MCGGRDLNSDFLERKIHWSETLDLSREEVDSRKVRISNLFGDRNKIRGVHLNNFLYLHCPKGVVV